MAEFESQDLRGSRFTGVNLRGSRFSEVSLAGARFRESDLTGAVLRSVDVDRVEIDAPWLYGGSLVVNSVDVVPLVDAELNRRFPGRSERRAADPDGLRAAWARVEDAWAALTDRARAMPAATWDVSVDDEWSFAQTLRHLVLATDLWLGKAILNRDRPYHPLGLSYHGADETIDPSQFATGTPSVVDVLAARADRQAMVGTFIAGVTADDLAAERPSPHDPQYKETVLSCLHTILEEEWEHLRFAVRDLDRIVADRSTADPPASPNP